ncbi:hypothetical protein CRI94_13545 [Longibacter salinarum]|uniref:Uncharacterized protein n=1 Tax=Longibacter salinarum TaxID=1850348 RepID=A0A2A8CV06_9BACT|nr:hypothetical protein [Longibacter salinarum]PEN12545.1 hypothetical protein CRI94_13545 [Longibacter salinarum]
MSSVSSSESSTHGTQAGNATEAERGRVLGWVAGWPEPVQWIFSSFLLAAVLYASALGVDRATRSPLDQLAALDVSETRIEGYRMNVADSLAAQNDTVSTDRLFLQALNQLREARTTTLGLFPRYEEVPLARSMSLLEEVIERESSASFLGLEARFFLAKAFLAQEKPDAARDQLQVLARRDNRRAAEAVQMLKRLQKVAPMQEPDTMSSPYD